MCKNSVQNLSKSGLSGLFFLKLLYHILSETCYFANIFNRDPFEQHIFSYFNTFHNLSIFKAFCSSFYSSLFSSLDKPFIFTFGKPFIFTFSKPFNFTFGKTIALTLKKRTFYSLSPVPWHELHCNVPVPLHNQH